MAESSNTDRLHQHCKGKQMKQNITKIILIIVAILLILAALASCSARFVFLAPSCFSDSNALSDEENDFIKKLVLESIEDRLSIISGETENIYDFNATDTQIIQLDKTQKNNKHVFILINSDFMRSVTKNENEYTVQVQTYFMEPSSPDCSYEIQISNHAGEYVITFFGLDP